MTSFRLAVLNLTRRKVLALIALVGITISVAASGILLRLYILSNARFSTIASGGEAVVGAKSDNLSILLGSLNLEGPYPDYVPYKLFESIRSQKTVQFEDGAVSHPSEVKSVIPFVYFGKYKDYRAVGTDENFVNRPKPEDSLHFKEGHWAISENEVVVGANVAASESLKVGDNFPLTIWSLHDERQPESRVQAGKVTVSGVLMPSQTMWDRGIYSNIPTAQNFLKNANLRTIWDANVLNYFLIYLQPQGFGALKDLINKRTVSQVINVETEKEKLVELTSTGRAFGFWFTVIIMALGGLTVCAMLVTRFDSMNVQLAVLRALGYSKAAVAQWLLFEGLILGFFACVLGAILDLCFFPVLRDAMGSSLPAADIVQSSILLSAPIWVTALAATVLAVFIPLYRLYRQDIHQSLLN